MKGHGRFCTDSVPLEHACQWHAWWYLPSTAAASRPFNPNMAPAAATPTSPIPGTRKPNNSTSDKPPPASARGTALKAGALQSNPLLKPAGVRPPPPLPPAARGPGRPGPCGCVAGIAERDLTGQSAERQCAYCKIKDKLCTCATCCVFQLGTSTVSNRDHTHMPVLAYLNCTAPRRLHMRQGMEVTAISHRSCRCCSLGSSSACMAQQTNKQQNMRCAMHAVRSLDTFAVSGPLCCVVCRHNYVHAWLCTCHAP